MDYVPCTCEISTLKRLKIERPQNEVTLRGITCCGWSFGMSNTGVSLVPLKHVHGLAIWEIDPDGDAWDLPREKVMRMINSCMWGFWFNTDLRTLHGFASYTSDIQKTTGHILVLDRSYPWLCLDTMKEILFNFVACYGSICVALVANILYFDSWHTAWWNPQFLMPNSKVCPIDGTKHCFPNHKNLTVCWWPKVDNFCNGYGKSINFRKTKNQSVDHGYNPSIKAIHQRWQPGIRPLWGSSLSWFQWYFFRGGPNYAWYGEILCFNLPRVSVATQMCFHWMSWHVRARYISLNWIQAWNASVLDVKIAKACIEGCMTTWLSV